MFGTKKHGARGTASDAIDGLSPYVDQLAHDEKLRQRLVAAFGATAAARSRARRQAGVVGVATRLASDPVLRAQVAEALTQLQKAKGRIRTQRSHKLRNWTLLLAGGGIVVAAVPSLRSAVMSKVRGHDDMDAPTQHQNGSHPIVVTADPVVDSTPDDGPATA
ncbi:MAG: hypothetical protein H0X39_17395 [Actinobacteria bacterium]|nr:hypothetical protein [Actinomycetota bacterium]